MSERMATTNKRRTRSGLLAVSLFAAVPLAACSAEAVQESASTRLQTQAERGAIKITTQEALQHLSQLAIKGRAPKTGYSRMQFGDGWASAGGCDTRNDILQRDLQVTALDADECTVLAGILDDPYTGTQIVFTRGIKTSSKVQIDHVVALGDAWQKGAQKLSPDQRILFANDPLELLAVDGQANEQKGDSDAATWLPPNKNDRCTYVAKQILVKEKYNLWVTAPEHDAMARVLSTCPNQTLFVAD
jgi:Protein of unknown function (DUF1524)